MEYLEDIIKTVGNLGPEALVMVAMLAFGYVLRIVPRFPNNWIPLSCLLFTLVCYPLLSNPGRVSFDAEHPLIRMELTALVLWVCAWLAQTKVLSKIEDKIPWLKGLLATVDAKADKLEVEKAEAMIEGKDEQKP